MFDAIALGALRRPLELIYFLMCTTGVLQCASKKFQKQLKTQKQTIKDLNINDIFLLTR